MDWRNKFYEQLRKENLQISFKTKKDVIKFFEYEFSKFTEPIRDLDNIKVNIERLTEYHDKFIIGEKIMDLDGEKADNTVTISYPFEDGTLRIAQVFISDGIIDAYINGKKQECFDENFVDKIFKKVFATS